MGKTVDLGALVLQNEQVRAVGNMGVNARGDIIDSNNATVDLKTKQVQRQYRRQTNVSDTPVASSNLAARKSQTESAQTPTTEEEIQETLQSLDSGSFAVSEPVAVPEQGGLAAAIARSREIKQELEKTLRQRSQEQGVRKI